MTEWIKCTERFPETDNDILVYAKCKSGKNEILN